MSRNRGIKMTRQIGLLLLAVGMLWGTCVWAQNDTGAPDNAAPTQPGPKPQFSYPDATPSLDFVNGAVENSSITLGIGGGFSYISNAYRYTGSPTNHNLDRWLFIVTPSIRIQQFRPKLSWNVGYSGGLQTYDYLGSGNTSTNSNYFSQTANAGFLWQMAPHWQMQGSEQFVHSANPFDSYLTQAGTPTQNNPNPVSYYPLTTFTLNQAFLTISNQLTKLDTLTITGTENLRQTDTYNLLSLPFYNLISYGGSFNYSHRFSPRLSLGGGYNYNSEDFGHGQQRSGIQTMQFTADYSIRPNVSITGWIGPEYTSTKSVVGIPVLGQIFYITQHNSAWSTALGMNFAWQGLRNSFRAGYTRQVSDGGGIIATAQVNSVNASYRRMMTAKLDLLAGLQYFHDVSTTVSSRSYDQITPNAGLTYKLAKSLSATFRYSYIHQAQSNTFLTGSATYNDNNVGVLLNYTWSHPLGR